VCVYVCLCVSLLYSIKVIKAFKCVRFSCQYRATRYRSRRRSFASLHAHWEQIQTPRTEKPRDSEWKIRLFLLSEFSLSANVDRRCKWIRQMDSAYALVNVTRTRSWKVSLEQIRIQILSACCSFREDDISRRRMTFDRTDSTFESFERATLRTSKSYVRSYLSCLRYNKLDFLSRHYSKLPVLRFPLRSYSLCDYSISDSLTLCSSGFTYHPNTIRKEMQRKENFSFLLALSLSLSFLLPLSFACYVTYRSDTIGPT